VNLPAKNVFILSNYIGSSKFEHVDFWNLAGRAGRLTEELSGNIICVRVPRAEFETRASWSNPEVDLEIVREMQVKKIKPAMLEGKNFYKNVSAALSGGAFTQKDPTEASKKIWKHYANIALIHEMRGDASTLRTSLIEKDLTVVDVLRKKREFIEVPDRILSLSSSIKAEYQNAIYTKKDPVLLGASVDYDSVLTTLGRMYHAYNWAEEESGGTEPLCQNEDVLAYLAVIASNWMGGMPLSQMIGVSIAYHAKTQRIYIDPTQPNVFFDPNSRKHLNIIINRVIGDIDLKLRFKLQRYFENYHHLMEERFGHGKAGVDWSKYLEYGTNDDAVIALQNFGVSRHLANYLLKHHREAFVISGTDLLEINKELLLEKFDKDADEYIEYQNSYLAV
jgi:hypothetical protein